MHPIVEFKKCEVLNQERFRGVRGGAVTLRAIIIEMTVSMSPPP